MDEARALAHDVEAHGRRWAVRIHGLPEPTSLPETTDETKELVIKFLKERLNIQSVISTDIDCAHRLGAFKGKKQTILTRFFRRDLADHVVRNKKMLKGSTTVVYEDSPQLSRDLMKALKLIPEVESTWYLGGKVWAKLKNGPKKYKFSINDNINTKVQKLYRMATAALAQQTTHRQPAQQRHPNDVYQAPMTPTANLNGATPSILVQDAQPAQLGEIQQPQNVPIDELHDATATTVTTTTLQSPETRSHPIPPIRHRRPTASIQA